MVAQLRDEDIKSIVGDSRAICRCLVAINPGSYDHKRWKAMKDAGTLQSDCILPEWDFVLVRAMEDGTETTIRLHPNYSNTIVNAVGEHEQDVKPPANGVGGSDGKGIYKLYKGIGVKAKLRFDVTKFGKAAAKVRLHPLFAIEDQALYQ